MTPVYIDAAIFVHALGRDERLRTVCASVLEAIGAGEVAAHSSVLVIEEIVHVRSRRLNDRVVAAEEGRTAAAIVALHDTTRPDLENALRIFSEHEALDARDAVHAAVAERLGLEVIVTTDSDFDGLPGLRRVDPRDRDQMTQLTERR